MLLGNSCFLPAKHHRKSWLYLIHTSKGQEWILHFNPARLWGAPSSGLGRCQRSRSSSHRVVTTSVPVGSVETMWEAWISNSQAPLPGIRRCTFPSHWGDTGAGPVETQTFTTTQQQRGYKLFPDLPPKSRFTKEEIDKLQTPSELNISDLLKTTWRGWESQIKVGDILQTTFQQSNLASVEYIGGLKTQQQKIKQYH